MGAPNRFRSAIFDQYLTNMTKTVQDRDYGKLIGTRRPMHFVEWRYFQ